MEREKVVFYKDYFEALQGQEPMTRLEAYEAIFEYAFYGTEHETDDPAVIMAFTLIKPQIDENNERFVNGCKGGRPRKRVPEQEEISEEPDEDPGKETDIADPAVNTECRGAAVEEHGQNGNVRLSTEEYSMAVKRFSEEIVKFYIEKLDQWLIGKPKLLNRKSHFDLLVQFINDNKGKISRASPGRGKVQNFANRFNNFEQHDYDFKSLEEQLVEN